MLELYCRTTEVAIFVMSKYLDGENVYWHMMEYYKNKLMLCYF